MARKIKDNCRLCPDLRERCNRKEKINWLGLERGPKVENEEIRIMVLPGAMREKQPAVRIFFSFWIFYISILPDRDIATFLNVLLFFSFSLSSRRIFRLPRQHYHHHMGAKWDSYQGPFALKIGRAEVPSTDHKYGLHIREIFDIDVKFLKAMHTCFPSL